MSEEKREVTELRMTRGLWLKLRFDFIDEVLKQKRIYNAEEREEAVEMLEELRLSVEED